MTDNPYSSPLAETPSKEVADKDLGTIARETFLAWEKLRIPFNGILISLTLAMGAGHLHLIEFWGTAIAGGLFVNACYFAGPIVETYVTWLGYRGRRLRYGLFVLGTLFTSAVAAVVMIGMKF